MLGLEVAMRPTGAVQAANGVHGRREIVGNAQLPRMLMKRHDAGRAAARHMQRDHARGEPRRSSEQRAHLAEGVEPGVTADSILESLDDDFHGRAASG